MSPGWASRSAIERSLGYVLSPAPAARVPRRPDPAQTPFGASLAIADVGRPDRIAKGLPDRAEIETSARSARNLDELARRLREAFRGTPGGFRP